MAYWRRERDSLRDHSTWQPARRRSRDRAVAVLLVLTGLYGVLSQLVGQRRREIGIRMALGATRRSIQGMILRRASLVALVGLSVGFAASLAVGRLLRAFLFG
jgi:ABC-type antimicrobial peptide transport system permease subunit